MLKTLKDAWRRGQETQRAERAQQEKLETARREAYRSERNAARDRLLGDGRLGFDQLPQGANTIAFDSVALLDGVEQSRERLAEVMVLTDPGKRPAVLMGLGETEVQIDLHRDDKTPREVAATWKKARDRRYQLIGRSPLDDTPVVLEATSILQDRVRLTPHTTATVTASEDTHPYAPAQRIGVTFSVNRAGIDLLKIQPVTLPESELGTFYQRRLEIVFADTLPDVFDLAAIATLAEQ